MNRFRLTGPARADVREIWNYMASQSERRADRLLEELNVRFQDLAEQPLLTGFADIIYGTKYRISPVRDYVIFTLLCRMESKSRGSSTGPATLPACRRFEHGAPPV